MIQKEKVAPRIAEVLQDQNLTMQELADIVSLSKATVSRYAAGKMAPKATFLNFIADRFGYNLQWLMGDTAVPKYTEPENIEDDSFSYTHIPDGISAGPFQRVAAHTRLPKINVPDLIMGRYAHDRDIVFMHVNGDSMNRVIADGSLIGVKTNLDRYQYKDGDIVIASDGRDYTVKYFYDDPAHNQFILVPNSTDRSFTPIICRYDEDDYTLFGRVVIYATVL